MKQFIKDAFQVTVALLITGSMASAMATPKPHIAANMHVNSIKAKTIAAVQAKTPAPAVVAAPAPPAPAAPPTPPPAPPAPVVPTTPDEIMAAVGIAQSDWPAVNYIISHESGWCATKWEGEIGYCPPFHGVSDYDGYGLCQSTPPQKMASAGSDWETNPVTQLEWCTSHADDTYGSWWAAYDHWIVSRNW